MTARLTVMLGLPGAGKSTLAQTLGGVILGADEIRTQNADPRKSFIRLHALVKRHLKRGEHCIVETCNLDPGERSFLLGLAKQYRAKTRLIVFTTPVQLCRLRRAGEMQGYDWGKAEKLYEKARVDIDREPWGERVTR
jgi:predicted kinase